MGSDQWLDAGSSYYARLRNGGGAVWRIIVPRRNNLQHWIVLVDEIAVLRKQVVLLRKQLTPNDGHAALEVEIDTILTRLDACVAMERKAMAAMLKRLRDTPRIAA